MVLSTRSEYFSALLQRSEDLESEGGGGSSEQKQQLPTLQLHGVTAGVCVCVRVFEGVKGFSHGASLHLASLAAEQLEPCRRRCTYAHALVQTWASHRRSSEPFLKTL